MPHNGIGNGILGIVLIMQNSVRQGIHGAFTGSDSFTKIIGCDHIAFLHNYAGIIDKGGSGASWGKPRFFPGGAGAVCLSVI